MSCGRSSARQKRSFTSVNTELTMRTYKQLVDSGMISKEQKLSPFLFEDFLKASKASGELDSKEMDYLLSKQEITFCADPSWLPFEGIVNGKHVGISADYFKTFQKKLPVPLRLIPTSSWYQTLDYTKARKCDVLALGSPTPERLAYLDRNNFV